MLIHVSFAVTGNGYIEGTELDGFLREFVSSANATDIGPEVIQAILLVDGELNLLEQ